jgi:hypothetical protein
MNTKVVILALALLCVAVVMADPPKPMWPSAFQVWAFSFS